MEKNRLKIVALIAGLVVAVPVAAFAIVILFLTVFEYRPAEIESVAVENSVARTVGRGMEIGVVSWNVGYGDLGDNADFFMDGGKNVRSSTRERNLENIGAVCANLKSHDSDIIFLQEVDLNSTRSYGIDQRKIFSDALGGFANSFASNFNVRFVPFPLPPIGKVYSGLVTFSRFETSGAYRVKLPSPFKWPVRVANLKRCLLVSRLPVEGSDKELVLVNLHLEAFDSGEGKAAQTRALCGIMRDELEKGNYVIAGGDFNQIFSTTDVSRYAQREGGWKPGSIDVADFGDGWNFIQDSASPTCRANSFPYKDADKSKVQYFVIDGFIVSENVRVLEARTVDYDFVNSDHNPVVMKVVLE